MEQHQRLCIFSVFGSLFSQQRVGFPRDSKAACLYIQYLLSVQRTSTMVACKALTFIKRLAEVTGGDVGNLVSYDDVVMLRAELSASDKKSMDVWASAAADGVSPQSVASTLEGAASDRPSSHGALAAAAAYIALLTSPGCPAFSLFSSLGFAAALRTLKSACTKVSNTNDDENHEENVANTLSDDGMVLARFILVDLAIFLDGFPLRDMPDVLKTVFDLLSEISRTTRANVASPPESEPLAAIATRIMGSLLRPEHGETLQSAAMLMQRLAPSLIGVTGEGVRNKNFGTSSASARVHAIGLVRETAMSNAVARPAISSLLRHLALRCGERADARSAAVDATLVILRALPPYETDSFTTFVTKLSRNPKVAQRLLATELAVALLENIPGPFLPSKDVSITGIRADGDLGTPTTCTPSSGGAQLSQSVGAKASTTLAPQPWGLRCAAMLIQRASDKAPIIRAKAMQGLSTAMHDAPAPLVALVKGEVSVTGVIAAATTHCAFKEGGTPRSGLRASVLGSATITKTPHSSSVTPSSGSVGDRSDCAGASEHSPHCGSPSLVATGVNLPAVLRRRCCDEKAAVRRSAVAALEGVVIALSNSFVGPSMENLTALAGACSDPLVSVRRQGMHSLSSLLAVFPVRTSVRIRLTNCPTCIVHLACQNC